jgi:hypothetical protein
MRRQLILGIALFCAAAGQAEAYDLSEHEWRHRLLFLVAPHAEDADLRTQKREIALRSDAILDRDLIVFELLADQGLRGETPLSREAVGALRRQLDVAAEDRLVILIGKDGGIKRRAGLDTDLADVFLQIDAMPMRRQEMRAKTEAGIPVTTP